MMKRAYRMSIMDGQVVAQKVMEEDQLLERGAQELDEYLELEGRYVGVFVLLHEDGVAQYLDSGTLYTLDGEIFVMEYPQFMESGKMYIVWDDELDEVYEDDTKSGKAVPVVLL